MSSAMLVNAWGGGFKKKNRHTNEDYLKGDFNMTVTIHVELLDKTIAQGWFYETNFWFIKTEWRIYLNQY